MSCHLGCSYYHTFSFPISYYHRLSFLIGCSSHSVHSRRKDTVKLGERERLGEETWRDKGLFCRRLFELHRLALAVMRRASNREKVRDHKPRMKGLFKKPFVHQDEVYGYVHIDRRMNILSRTQTHGKRGRRDKAQMDYSGKTWRWKEAI